MMAEQTRLLCNLEKRVDDMAVETNNRPLPSGIAFQDIADAFGGLRNQNLYRKGSEGRRAPNNASAWDGGRWLGIDLIWMKREERWCICRWTTHHMKPVLIFKFTISHLVLGSLRLAMYFYVVGTFAVVS